MFVHHIVVLYFCTYVYQIACIGGTDVSNNISAIAYNYCPISTFCRTGSETQPSLIPCCDQCSCEEDCYLGNRCCPDADIVPSVNDLLVCRSMDELFNSHRNITEELGDLNRGYYVIDSCPESFGDADVIGRCLVPQTIREHVLVSDPGTTLIYKNYQCAICNEVLDYDFWNLKLLCSHSNTIYSVLVDDDTIFRHCKFDSKPSPLSPLSIAGNQTWACNPKAIHTCNVTGQWDAYDDVIVDACATYNIPYKAETFQGGDLFSSQVYANVFCYLCNTKTGDAPSRSTCLLGYGSPFDGLDPLGFSFSAMLDLLSFEAVHNIEEPEGQCNVNELVDPFTGRCNDVLCPFGQVPFFGDCTSYMRDIKLAYVAVLGYEFTAYNGIPWLEDTSPKEIMYDILLETIEYLFVKEGCTFCDLILSPQAILIQAKSSETCPNEVLLQFLNTLSRLTKVKSVYEEVELKMWITAKFSSVQNNVGRQRRIPFGDLEFIRERFGEVCMGGVQLPPKFYCKRIMFSVFDLVHNGITHATLARVLSKSEPDEYINGMVTKYAICVDDYSSIANQGSRVGSSRMTWLAVTLCILATKGVIPFLYAYQASGVF